ncbi:MAG: rRNA maturation RNase YbeY [Bacteroidota bacterium]|nr:rRNA maturation RNase YbeY [Bacteroidota bacterium]
MGTILFNNNGISPSLKYKPFLKIFLTSIFAEEGYDFKSVSYIFCTDEYLLKLNQKYLKHDTLTDIITFTLSETSFPIISEIYISVERVKENSLKLDETYETEMQRVMIHGILHLCGYSDHTPELKIKMRAKEDYYLARMNFN